MADRRAEERPQCTWPKGAACYVKSVGRCPVTFRPSVQQMRTPVGRTISPPRRARLSPCEHGRTTEPIARRTGDPCPEEPSPWRSPCVALAPATALAAPPDPLARGPYTATTARSGPDRARPTCRSPTPPAARSTGPAAAATLQVRGSIYYPANRATRLAGDPARARQPRQLRLRLGAELHGLQAQRPRLRVPGREPRDLGLHGHVARPGPAHLLPGQRTGQGHAPAPPADRRGARRALRRQPGADAGQRRQQPRRRARRQARLLARRPDGPLARRRRRLELHRLQPHAPGARAAGTTCAASSRSPRSTTSAARPTACRT